MKLTLNANAYSWDYQTVKGSYRDTGSARCHGKA